MYVCMYVCVCVCCVALLALVGSGGAVDELGFWVQVRAPSNPPPLKKKTGKQSYYCNTVLSILTSGLYVERKREGRAAASGLESPGLRVSGTKPNPKP